MNDKIQVTIEDVKELETAFKTYWEQITNEHYVSIIEKSLGAYVMNKPEQLKDALEHLENFKQYLELPIQDRPLLFGDKLSAK
jgi:hypothetical protein